MALRSQEEYGDRVHTIFVESQGADMQRVEEFAMARGWLGTSAMWTTERPVRSTSRGLPSCVVLDADGKVALTGHPGSLHKQIEELIKQAARPRPPEDLPRELRDAWKDMVRGELADAHAAATRVAEREDDDTIRAAATALAKEVLGRADRRARRIASMVQDGAFLAARELAEELEDALDGLESGKLAAEWIERLDSDEFEAEIDAEKDLARVRAALFEKGPDPRYARALRKVAEDHPGTKAARTAQRWIPMMGDGGI